MGHEGLAYSFGVLAAEFRFSYKSLSKNSRGTLVPNVDDALIRQVQFQVVQIRAIRLLSGLGEHLYL